MFPAPLFYVSIEFTATFEARNAPCALAWVSEISPLLARKDVVCGTAFAEGPHSQGSPAFVAPGKRCLVSSGRAIPALL